MAVNSLGPGHAAQGVEEAQGPLAGTRGRDPGVAGGVGLEYQPQTSACSHSDRQAARSLARG